MRGKRQDNWKAAIGPGLDADRPIVSARQDRLGFGPLAKALATAIVGPLLREDGIVVGIEGKWGSGKSSLINLLIERLKERETGPAVVRFEPWIVGNRDGMLPELLCELQSAVEQIGCSQEVSQVIQRKSEKIVGILRTYGAKLGQGAAPVARFAGLLGVPGLTLTADLLDEATKAIQVLASSEPVQKLKDSLVKELSTLPYRIVVVIDDLDRLEPSELGEVLRLVRAVADFPNITYVLSYDPDVLAIGLSKALGGVDGKSFLEKIVQASFRVPQPEVFDLRTWLLDDCAKLYQAVSSADLPHEASERLQEVCGIEGEAIHTPRDVVRILNALRLFWAPVAEEVDFADMVWLQLLRISNEGLYSWVERYLADYMALVNGAQIVDSDRVKYAGELADFVNDEISLSSKSLWRFRAIVPGIWQEAKVAEPKALFKIEGDSERAKAERSRRLSSPQHFRYYFALSKPAGALDDAEFHLVLQRARTGRGLETLFKSIAHRGRPQGGTMARVLIGRLYLLDGSEMAPSVVSNLVRVLSNCMDDVGYEEGPGEFGTIWSWQAAEALFKKFFLELAPAQRQELVSELFSSGRAIGWLMCELVRGEIFAHGRYGDRRVPESEWLFSDDQLTEAIELLTGRFRGPDRPKIIKTPELLGLLYGWLQSGDQEGVHLWIEEQRSTDKGFLRMIDAFRGTSRHRRREVIRRRDIEAFLDFKETQRRLRGIVTKSAPTSNACALAYELLRSITDKGD